MGVCDVSPIIEVDVILLVAAGIGRKIAVVGYTRRQLEKTRVGSAEWQVLDNYFIPVGADLS